MDHGILCYGRWYKNNKIAVVINNNDFNKEVVVPMWRLECDEGNVIERIISSTADGFTEEIEKYKVVNGCITVNVPPYSSNVYVRKERVIYNDFEIQENLK
jgi:alpha-glucosidase